ncbi:NAD-P-binding protein [Cystobasidium minutum MCA 4210]|uniref:NAD-P-binding protein n=1 Tax=Cystobasidium minutum MCA 4210 TaxID=1397322 RepID=UPI0034CFFB4E|eukprot:jgi/Rhomi1/110955/CE110954_1196
MADIQHRFFTASDYAVAGASNNTSKFGYKLLEWYHSRGIPVTPITPTSDEILGLKCVSDVAKLVSDKSNTSLSIVTPPKITKAILEQASKEAELKALWLQPGAEDRDVVDYINSNEWLKERTVYGGPCVLVLGDKLRKDVAAQGKL